MYFYIPVTYGLLALSLATPVIKAELAFSPTCDDVPDAGDMRDFLQNEAFPNIVKMAENAITSIRWAVLGTPQNWRERVGQ